MQYSKNLDNFKQKIEFLPKRECNWKIKWKFLGNQINFEDTHESKLSRSQEHEPRDKKIFQNDLDKNETHLITNRITQHSDTYLNSCAYKSAKNNNGGYFFDSEIGTNF